MTKGRASLTGMRCLPLLLVSCACAQQPTATRCATSSPPQSASNAAWQSAHCYPGVITGAPLPSAVAEPTACEAADGFRWLAHDPHVPLAVTTPTGIETAKTCCAAWARVGDRWTAIDGQGAPLGDVTVLGGKGYDVTQCYELDLGKVPVGTVAFVRGGRPWQQPRHQPWLPTAEQRQNLLALARSLDEDFAPPALDTASEESARPIEERVRFFSVPGDPNGDSVATRFAAMAGRTVAIAGLDPKGNWRLHYLDGSWGLAAGPWIVEPYQLLGVFDMDGDGYPEVLVHRRDGPSWDDVILGCNNNDTLRPWAPRGESVGGSTA